MEELFAYIFFGSRTGRIIIGSGLILGGGILWLINEDAAKMWWLLAMMIAIGLFLIGFTLRGFYQRIGIGCFLIIGGGALWLTGENGLQYWWILAIIIACALLLIGLTIRGKDQPQTQIPPQNAKDTDNNDDKYQTWQQHLEAKKRKI